MKQGVIEGFLKDNDKDGQALTRQKGWRRNPDRGHGKFKVMGATKHESENSHLFHVAAEANHLFLCRKRVLGWKQYYQLFTFV